MRVDLHMGQQPKELGECCTEGETPGVKCQVPNKKATRNIRTPDGKDQPCVSKAMTKRSQAKRWSPLGPEWLPEQGTPERCLECRC